MNFFKFIISVTLLILTVSCEKIFHPEEQNISTINSYEELLKAVNGVYGLFQENIFYLDDANIKGDDINIGNPVYETDYNSGRCWANVYIDRSSYDWESWNSGTSYTWAALYEVVISINNILNQYDISSMEGKNEKVLIGEMFFLRAYLYFRLVRTYGEIPIVDNIDVDYSVKKAPSIDVYNFIESDLKRAMYLLPANYQDARLQGISVHRGSAKALMAEVYLSWAGYPNNDKSKYEIAAKTAKEVIDSADVFGFALLEDFGYLWDQNHLYNSESVFSIYYQNPQIYAGTKTLSWQGVQQAQLPYNGRLMFWEYSDGISIAPEEYISIRSAAAEIKFYKDFPVGYRKEITFFTNYWEFSRTYEYDSINDSYKVFKDSAHYRLDSTSLCCRAAFRKFYYDPYIFDYYYYYEGYDTSEFMEKETSFIGSPRISILRYTHTVLTYAEACARSGHLNSEAIDYVNRIRRRARHLDIYASSQFDLRSDLPADVFADSVVWERAWEFAGELEGRWFDLVRLEKVEDLPYLRNSYEQGPPAYPITKGTYFSPIPENDKILNPNLNK